MTDIAFTSVAPVIPVRDLDAALERYRRLGFAALSHSGPARYGFVDRGDPEGTLHRVGSPLP